MDACVQAFGNGCRIRELFFLEKESDRKKRLLKWYNMYVYAKYRFHTPKKMGFLKTYKNILVFCMFRAFYLKQAWDIPLKSLCYNIRALVLKSFFDALNCHFWTHAYKHLEIVVEIKNYFPKKKRLLKWHNIRMFIQSIVFTHRNKKEEYGLFWKHIRILLFLYV